MTLNDKLQAMKIAARGKLPSETMQIMDEALDAVEATGQQQRALKAGDLAPDFVLEDHTGQLWSSRSLLQQGPLVVNFYRGSW
jgi:hypothetical protein